MPLFEIDANRKPVAFRRRTGQEGLYEREIEDLLWEHFEELTGEEVLLVARQRPLPEGGRPDLIALDRNGGVVVIEIKRAIDRRQLAQCLEYAGWARGTNLDEIASMYHGGPAAFYGAWEAFTDRQAPMAINGAPRLILIAQDFHARTRQAFDFLDEHKVPIRLTRMSLWEDKQGRTFVDIEGEHEPDIGQSGGGDEVPPTSLDGRRVLLTDLLDAGILRPDQALVWDRPRLNQTYNASVTADGNIRLEDGREFASPSGAAREAAGLAAYDGWYAWRVADTSRESLHQLRERFLAGLAENAADAGVPDGVPNPPNPA